MNIDDCYQLGKITKPWGIKGQVIFFLDVDTPEDYIGLDAVFVEIKGTLVPYFIHIDNLNGNKATVSIEGTTADEATALVGHDLYLPLDRLPKLTGNKFYYHEVIGFKVVDENYGDVGEIQKIIESPAQPLFQIFKNGTEVLVPIIDPILKKVDREHRTIHIEAPNGLIELYLGDINK